MAGGEPWWSEAREKSETLLWEEGEGVDEIHEIHEAAAPPGRAERLLGSIALSLKYSPSSPGSTPETKTTLYVN